MADLSRDLPLVTADLPGIGGRIKERPEDFQVEEIPAYSPSGKGDFLYLWVEKRGLGAEYFAAQVAQRLGIAPTEVGMAGLKDRQAVTRQMISVPARVEERLSCLEGEGIRLLAVSRHTNKLKPGHLHGNRFRVLIRGEMAAAQIAARLPPLLARLREQGLPNYYGPQRFGRGGETLQLGLALLRGQETPALRHRPDAQRYFLRKFALSAVQAELFNYYLAQRLHQGLWRRVLAGDVLARWPRGGLFLAEDVPREQARFEARETVITGPIFGRKTFPAGGEAAPREQAVLTAFQLTPQAFAAFGKLMQGTRRPLQVYLEDLHAEITAEGVWLTFTLPAGSYATVLLREIMKSDAAAAQLAEEAGEQAAAAGETTEG
jgi:tRNA pseudouridine13 synthase